VGISSYVVQHQRCEETDLLCWGTNRASGSLRRGGGASHLEDSHRGL